MTTDPLAHVRETVADLRGHAHPPEGQGEDIYCLNLSCYLGERMGGVLAEYDRVVAERDAARRQLATMREISRAVGVMMGTHSRDWGQDRGDALLWGIFCGWDDEDPEDPKDSAMAELAAKHGWDERKVARLRRFHTAIEALDGHAVDVEAERALVADWNGGGLVAVTIDAPSTVDGPVWKPGDRCRTCLSQDTYLNDDGHPACLTCGRSDDDDD